MLTLPEAPNGRLPIVDRILNELDDEEQQQLRGWLADPAISAPRIAQALAAAGHRVSSSTIVSYRADRIR